MHDTITKLSLTIKQHCVAREEDVIKMLHAYIVQASLAIETFSQVAFGVCPYRFRFTIRAGA